MSNASDVSNTCSVCHIQEQRAPHLLSARHIRLRHRRVQLELKFEKFGATVCYFLLDDSRLRVEARLPRCNG